MHFVSCWFLLCVIEKWFFFLKKYIKQIKHNIRTICCLEKRYLSQSITPDIWTNRWIAIWKFLSSFLPVSDSQQWKSPDIILQIEWWFWLLCVCVCMSFKFSACNTPDHSPSYFETFEMTFYDDKRSKDGNILASAHITFFCETHTVSTFYNTAQ